MAPGACRHGIAGHAQYTAFARRVPKYYVYNGGQEVRGGQFHWWRCSSRGLRWYLGNLPQVQCRVATVEACRLSLQCSHGRKCFRKLYLMPRNLGRPHTPPRGARALAGADLPPIERWNRGRGQRRGEGTNRLRCRSAVSFAHGNALCIAKELGAVSKPALDHFITLVVNLAVISPADK